MGINELKIEKDFENKLLKRRELEITLEYEGMTPSREEIKRRLADKYNMKQENMVIVRVEQLYGTNKAKALIHEYGDAESMKIAQKHILSRPNKEKKVKAPAESKEAVAAPEEKKEEAKGGEEKQ